MSSSVVPGLEHSMGNYQGCWKKGTDTENIVRGKKAKSFLLTCLLLQIFNSKPSLPTFLSASIVIVNSAVSK